MCQTIHLITLITNLIKAILIHSIVINLIKVILIRFIVAYLIFPYLIFPLSAAIFQVFYQDFL